MPAWLNPRRLVRPRNLGYLSLALLARETPEDHEVDDDGASSTNGTVVGEGGLAEQSGLMAEFEEKQHNVLATSCSSSSRLEALKRVSKRFSFLLPSFMVDDGKAPARLHPSAWLDGLRGVAAFLVVWHHSSLLFFTWTIHNGFLSHNDDKDHPFPGGEQNLFIQWPFLRLVIAGAPQVKVFFVVSGFALSYKPLKLIRQGPHKIPEFASALSSSVFRRHLRLFLPALVVTFASAVAGFHGLFGADNRPKEEKEANPTWNAGAAADSRVPPTFATWSEQFWHWFSTMLGVMDPFNGNERRGATQYDWNLWTLPMEFDCSMMVFLFLCASAFLRSGVRMAMGVGIAGFALWYAHWPQFLFLSGLLLCDLGFHLEKAKPSILPERNNGNQSSDGMLAPPAVGPLVPITPTTSTFSLPSRITLPTRFALPSRFSLLSRFALPSRSQLALPPRYRPLAWNLLSLASFLAALHLLAFPELNRGGRNAPGYATLAQYIPPSYERDSEGHWWISIGAVLLIGTIARAPFLQRIFTTRFAQYLGRISFALYLVHGPLIWSVGWHLGQYFTDKTGRETNAQYGRGVALSYVFLWPVLIWAADVTWRLVDIKSVDCGRWLWEKVIRREGS